MPPEIAPKSVVDYYRECGGSAHFIVLSVILFIAVALHVVSKKKENSVWLIVPYAILPFIIGICGTSFYLQRFLTSMLSRIGDQAPWQQNLAECLYPIVAGSFLSALFIILIPVIQHFAVKPNA